jgi:hypothetical protein
VREWLWFALATRRPRDSDCHHHILPQGTDRRDALPQPTADCALTKNLHRVGQADLGLGRPQRCCRSLWMRGAIAALGGQDAGVAGVGIAPGQVVLLFQARTT